jgi:hypothetical protein
MNHLFEPMLRPLSRFAHGLAEHSQRQACRNAMVASTALTARRQEREEVQVFVEDLLARRAPVVETSSSPRTAAQLG